MTFTPSKWKRPLTGKKIVLTRARHQVKSLQFRLRQYGATPIAIPSIEIVDPPDGKEHLKRILQEEVITSSGTQAFLKYEWLIFTSSNGVDRFMQSVRHWERQCPAHLHIDKVKIAVIGPGTLRRLRRWGLKPEIQATDHLAEGLLEKFQAIEPDNQNEFEGRILLPRAAKARNILPDTLRNMGWAIDDVPVYQTIIPKVEKGSQDLLSSADAIVFMSSSTAQNFVQMFGKEYLPEVVVSIGAITTQTILNLGFIPTIEASPSSVKGIVTGLLNHYSTN